MVVLYRFQSIYRNATLLQIEETRKLLDNQTQDKAGIIERLQSEKFALESSSQKVEEERATLQKSCESQKVDLEQRAQELASLKQQCEELQQTVQKVSAILGRELGPGGVSPNQRSRWKLAFSLLKHV